MTIFCIDQATNSGYTILQDGTLADFGEFSIKIKPKENPGIKWLAFENWVSVMHERYKFDLVIYERVSGMHKNSIIHSAKLVGILEKLSLELCYGVECYSAKAIKKRFTGNGNAKKYDMVAKAQEYYDMPDLKSFDIADALGIAFCAVEDYESHTKTEL